MSRLAKPGAASHEHLHGDEHLLPELTPAEQDAIEKRADEIIEDRLAYGDISGLFDGLDYNAWVPEVQRACRNIEQAMSTKFEEIGGAAPHLTSVFVSLFSVRRTLQIEARRVWGDDAREQAEMEICGDA